MGLKRKCSTPSQSPPSPSSSSISSASASASSSPASTSSATLSSPTFSALALNDDSGRTRKRYREYRPSSASIYTRTLGLLWRAARSEDYGKMEEVISEEANDNDDDDDGGRGTATGEEAMTLDTGMERGQKTLGDFWALRQR